MSAPVEQKAELQPVHRVFLGELFVFVFFFAGAMSVLVGPLAVSVATAGMTIGAAVVLSGLCFLWLAFTTPMRKAEPRYAFMVLSLLPGLLICAGVMGFLKLNALAEEHREILSVSLLDLQSPGLDVAATGASSTLYADEIAAIEDALRANGFTEQYSGFTRRWRREGPNPVAVILHVDSDVSPGSSTGNFYFRAYITNYDQDSTRRYFTAVYQGWVQILFKDLMDAWRLNIDARMKVKQQGK